MSAHTQKRRPTAEAIATPLQVDRQWSSTASDSMQHTLTLIRVQPSATAARGRGLVRFFTDLTERPIPAVATCDHCRRMYNVEVDFSGEKPVVRRLPGNCHSCATPLDTYEMNRDLIGSARYYAETAHLVNQFEPDGGAA